MTTVPKYGGDVGIICQGVMYFECQSKHHSLLWALKEYPVDLARSSPYKDGGPYKDTLARPAPPPLLPPSWTRVKKHHLSDSKWWTTKEG